MRYAKIERNTKETKIICSLSIDGSGKNDISTGIDFFDHMLSGFAVHSSFDISLTCKGDLAVDCHHTVEDVGIVLGQCFLQALGDKVGIERMSSIFVPMDETLSRCALDISGRAFLNFSCNFTHRIVGTFELSMVEEFLRAFCFNAQICAHISNEYGSNDHHKAESIFKSLARCLKAASKISSNEVISSKGVL